MVQWCYNPWWKKAKGKNTAHLLNLSLSGPGHLGTLYVHMPAILPCNSEHWFFHVAGTANNGHGGDITHTKVRHHESRGRNPLPQDVEMAFSRNHLKNQLGPPFNVAEHKTKLPAILTVQKSNGDAEMWRYSYSTIGVYCTLRCYKNSLSG